MSVKLINAYLFLLGATIAEIIGTVALKMSDGMTNLIPSVTVIVFYILAFWFAALALKVLPLSTASAIWAGFCIVGLGLIGILFFGETSGWAEIAGILMILTGTILLALNINTSNQ